MADKPKAPNPAAAGAATHTRQPWPPTDLIDAATTERAGSDTVERDPRPPDMPAVASEQSRPFALVKNVDADDSAVRQLLSNTLNPDGGRLASEGEFARGGMGVIEHVTDRVLLRHLAAKVIRDDRSVHDSAVRNFVREAQITGQLDHPNIVPIHELGTTPDGRLCFTMKLVEGKTLGDLIAALPSGPLERGRLLDLIDVVMRVCDALAFAHSRGVIHCDVKPRNVMVAEHGQVYLMDWGLARLFDVEARPAVRPVVCSVEPGKEARIRGTPTFMSPEQAHGAAADVRTDVFAVGGLLYTILCRRPPYPGRDRVSALRRARRCNFPNPVDLADGVPLELNRIVLKAMALHPGRRYASIAELQHDLKRFVREGDFPRVEYAAGTAIMREGDVGEAAYIIESGRCEVVKQIDGESVRIREMGPGEVFGETAILTAAPRTAGVIALEPTVLLEVTREVLDQEVGAMKPWMGEFIRTLAHRFRESQG